MYPFSSFKGHFFKLGGGLLFFFMVIYWTYLIVLTQPIIVHDAQTYQALGQMLHEHGWVEYFKTGPNREPLYPALVALAMSLNPQDYFFSLKILQFMLLGCSMMMLYGFMRFAKIHPALAGSVVLYMGFSPALVNSALSVYSEIVTYPGILMIVMLSVLSWLKLNDRGWYHALAAAIAFSVAFILVIFSKAIYEMIFMVYLIPFAVLGVKAWQTKNFRVFKNVLVFIITAVCLVEGSVVVYKSLNNKYNGVYAFTDRGAWALYGNTARRQGPMTFERVQAGLAYNLFELKGCEKLFSAEACGYWDLPTSDKLAADKNYEVIAQYPSQERDQQLLRQTAEKIIHNPIQYVLLSPYDFLHMFFWESTHIGFVVYPDVLQSIWDVTFFHDALRWLLASLSIASFVFGVFYLSRSFSVYLFFPVYLILWHNFLYAMFSTLPRYALVIAPIYLFLMGAMAEIIRVKRKRKYG